MTSETRETMHKNPLSELEDQLHLLVLKDTSQRIYELLVSGAYPPPSDLPHIHTTILKLEADIVREERNSTYPSTVLALKGQERLYRSLLSPIRKLPSECLSVIFMHAVEETRFSCQHFNLHLKLICSHWYRIYRSNPRIWSTITLSHYDTPFSGSAYRQTLQYLSNHLNRSHTPLFYEIHAPSLIDLLNTTEILFADHARRIRSLEFCLSSREWDSWISLRYIFTNYSLSQLHTLHLLFSPPPRKDPRLRHRPRAQSHPVVADFPPHLPPTLRTMILSQVSFLTAQMALAHFSRHNSRLTRVEITLRVTHKDNRYLEKYLQFVPGGFSINLLSLEHFSILELPDHESTGDGTTVYPGALKLLRLIHLSPTIRTIRFSQYQPAYSEDKTNHFRTIIPRFLSRTFTNLRTLDIGRYTEWIWHYEMILEAAPESIEELIMRDSYPTFVCPDGGYRHEGVLRMLCWPAQRQIVSEEDTTTLPSTTTKVGYLPRLTHLKIYTISLWDWDPDLLVELVSSRIETCEAEGPSKRLRYLQLSYDNKTRAAGPSKDLLDRLKDIPGLDLLVDAAE